ncbi:SMP-30/gluconolactonase/LRE family protein [Acetobacter fallax]|uniref:SMP-30/gluconolactonase/LRE family protein n=1 Tax=Acetobacter fallax TaxID=1737473 RepID=A0ABX0KCD8_9PROT|nr:SMP-30/gluconolactonase/LRE family protein [Acetobacter fallax]NHO33458.1 SMP-30/gluconolactonase/LRE family protein [Acetobacter fallax]NHO37063.1 SMP-30/gluconolactonase/LRE family protein [Acetobacter fallax]
MFAGVLAGFEKASARGPASEAVAVVTPPDVVSAPPRMWGDGAPVGYAPDPDIIVEDPSFRDLLYGNALLTQAWRGDVKWLEGPAWCVEGRFLLVSDVIGSVQYRYSDNERTMAVFRKESYHSNGNTFDADGRLISCEHGLRRVIRWEHDGRCQVLADACEGKHLNSPNDVVVHPDGGVWFTDPPFGDRLWEGHPDAPAGPGGGTVRWDLDAEVLTEMGGRVSQPGRVYRVDPKTGEVAAVLSEGQLFGPNGLCFSPDGKTLYVVSSGRKGGGANEAFPIYAFDVSAGMLSGQRVFCDMMVGGRALIADGVRADVAGNIWVGTSGPVGLCGVLVFNPAGKRIGRLRLPRGISNLTFGGTQRDRLFMCAQDAIFTLDVATQGAGFS